jgi:hypothetical protein
LIAGFTNSDLSVEVFTLGFNFTANSISVEIIMSWTLNTDSIIPSFAAEVIIKNFDKFGVAEFISLNAGDGLTHG